MTDIETVSHVPICTSLGQTELERQNNVIRSIEPKPIIFNAYINSATVKDSKEQCRCAQVLFFEIPQTAQTESYQYNPFGTPAMQLSDVRLLHISEMVLCEGSFLPRRGPLKNLPHFNPYQPPWQSYLPDERSVWPTHRFTCCISSATSQSVNPLSPAQEQSAELTRFIGGEP